MILPEFIYLENYIQFRLDTYFEAQTKIEEPTIPAYSEWALNVPQVIKTASLSKHENTLLLLALCPHVRSNLLDRVIQEKLASTGDFPQLGGVRGKNYRGFLPTGETALFLLAGDNYSERQKVYEYFGAEHFFARHQILWLEDSTEREPKMSGKLILAQEYLELLFLGKITKPTFSMKFPAQMLDTKMDWDDLVLNDDTMNQINELQTWINHGETLLEEWEMHKKLKPGYRVLFHGPPGTGKTLTASLLGKYTNREVYKIDLSMVVSKFIGETEKNLSNLLARAEKTQNILFFDEADALFGKRTGVRDAHDKYANQEVSYLLQRIEDYKGLVILASNLKSNIDEAFVRRFQAIIHFPLPKASERLSIWQKAFPSQVELSKDLDLIKISEKYELSGAEIMNVVQYACLCALHENKNTIHESYILKGVRREFEKGGRIIR